MVKWKGTLEVMGLDLNFWKNKKVFLTGHTGFKGSWLSIWLNTMDAKVYGYALTPPTNPSLYEIAEIDKFVKNTYGDVRNLDSLKKSISEANPDIVIHMAAQSLVRASYESPVDTYSTNVMGTVNVLEAVRASKNVRSVVIVTTDKCYENKEWDWGYRENEAMGGYDPYSNSKGCAELVTASYRSSFFNPDNYDQHQVGVASARAGNVIGGGDWARDRLIPDLFHSVLKNEPLLIRSPNAIRPWQHVLEPLGGYLLLAQKLYAEGNKFSDAWNFGPNEIDAKPVSWIVDYLAKHLDQDLLWEYDKNSHPHEANYLKLDISKAKNRLGWTPKINLEMALKLILEWFQAYQKKENLHQLVQEQIHFFTSVNNKL